MGNKGQGQTSRMIRVFLSCGCERRFESAHAPAVNEEMYCVKHNKAVTVKSFQYHWLCLAPSCRMHKFYGNAKVSCEIYAARHALRYQGHVIELYDKKNELYMTMGREPVATLGF